MPQADWFRPLRSDTHVSVREMRLAALGVLDLFPDFCHWQERSPSDCSAYCHLSSGIERLRRSLRDERWDDADLYESDEPEFQYLYEMGFLNGNELLGELALVLHNPAGARQKPARSAERNDIDRYVNHF